MTDQNKNRSLHDLRQPITAILNFAGAGARMADNGADHHALGQVFAQIQAQAEQLSELCKLQEKYLENRGGGVE